MKKFVRILFKTIFSRIMITVALLLVQIIWLLIGFKLLGDYSQVTSAVMGVISAALLIYLINKDEMPEFKLAWVIPICVAPVFGALLYLYVVGDWGNRGLKKQLERRLKETEEFLHTDSEAEEKLEQADAHMRGLAHYIEKVGGFPAYTDSSAAYFPQGEDKYTDMLLELEKAQEFIFLEYFIVGRGVMWDTILEILKRKAKAGVEVRLMYDGMGSVLFLPYSYPKQLKEFGIKCKIFSPIVPLLSTRQNNRDHRKILVIDGKTAYTGGINLADEYINTHEKYGHWKDAAIKVEGAAVRSFTMMFLQMWNVPEHGNEDYARYLRWDKKATGSNLGIVIPYGDSPTIEENLAETIYMDIINQAVSYVHIMTPYFIVDNAMLDVLQFAARRGVDVRIIIPHVPDKKPVFAISRTYYTDLLAAGIQVYEYAPGFIHSKVFVSDDEKAVVGSINLDYRSLYHHFECAAYLYQNSAVEAVERDFQETLQKCIAVDMTYYKNIPVWNRLAGRVLRLFGPLM